MTAISELIKAGNNLEIDNARYGVIAAAALPDLQRLVEWVKQADHKIHCDTDNGRECDCGLFEILKLLED